MMETRTYDILCLLDGVDSEAKEITIGIDASDEEIFAATLKVLGIENGDDIVYRITKEMSQCVILHPKRPPIQMPTRDELMDEVNKVITVDEKGYRRILGYLNDDIVGNGPEWALDFYKRLNSASPLLSWSYERDDTGIYLNITPDQWPDDTDLMIHDSADEPVDDDDNMSGESLIADTQNFGHIPLLSGEMWDQDGDDGACAEHTEKLFEEALAAAKALCSTQ